MRKVVLVAGDGSRTGEKLVESLLLQNCSVILPLTATEEKPAEPVTKELTTLAWNRGSWFSTKNIVREAVRTHKTIDAAWIIHNHTPDRTAFPETESSDIETVMEQIIKGTLALVREIVPILEQSHGFIGMVFPHRSPVPADPLTAMADGAFLHFSDALIKQVPENVWACGFLPGPPNSEGCAKTLLHQWNLQSNKLRGRWCISREGLRGWKRPRIIKSILKELT